MQATTSLRVTALLGAGVLGATLLAATVPEPAEAARACRIDVTTQLADTERFAGGSTAKYYWATSDGSAVGQYDHAANVIMTTFPVGARPNLMYKKIGEREAIGSMAQSQTPEALGAINADFFVFADIRGTNDIEMARGAMVSNGSVIRGTYRKQRVVGIDSTLQPFGGELSVRGFVQASLTGAPRTAVRSVNWHQVLEGGVNVYTPDWNKSTPRPAGTTEWVVNSRNKVKSVRLPGSSLLGAPVEARTRVLAFSSDADDNLPSVAVGTKVRVKVNQLTTTGVQLQTAVGRGLELIQDGKPAHLGCGAYAKSGSAVASRPRMFIGWDGQGRWRTFTVPGTRVYLKNGSSLQREGGMGLASAANVAKKLGMRYAFELDGGGSTSLWTRAGTQWSRKDLYGMSVQAGCTCERWMANGLSFLPAP